MLSITLLTLQLLLLSSAAVANPGAKHQCRDFLIPVGVTAPYYDINLSINSDWDLLDYIINSTRRDSQQTFKPIGGNHSESTNYTIGATFCAPANAGKASGTVLLLTAGTMVDHSYWDPVFKGSEKYSFVQHALNEGYSVFSYDRLGTGRSTRPDPISHAQAAPQVEILTTLTKLVQQPNSPYTGGTAVNRVVHIGHSFGAFLVLAAQAATSQQPSPSGGSGLGDAVVLTGYSGLYNWLSLFTGGSQVRIAAQADPKKWSGLPRGYVVPADLYSASYGGFKTPYFDREVAEWLYDTQQPIALGDLVTAGTLTIDLANIKVPVQVVQGRYDLTACGGFCDGLLDNAAASFPNSPRVDVDASFDGGHLLNFHFDGKRSFQAITDFVGQ
ncbi:Alpha/Beta hydrolase protein, partial [Chaetomium sp. MPI-SDFR-AT-0129]